MAHTPTIVVLEGDQTGQELLEEAIRVLSPEVIGLPLNLVRYDLSLENRRATQNRVVYEAAAAMREAGFGLKAATITPEGRGDVGSPNAILRREIDGTVILRTGRALPGVETIGQITAPITVVRMATEDAYEAKEWREGEGDEARAYRTTYISARNCRATAEISFRLARQTGGVVFGGPKWTVSPTYEGMLKEAMDAAARRYPDVPYDPQLIDAAYALLFARASRPLVIPCLNRDGDILSDLVLALYGSIAGAESLLIAFDDDFRPRVVMAEAPHGTAPSLQGKNVANPLAMQLAAGALLRQMDDPQYRQAGEAIQEACLDAVAAGVRTADLGGTARTTEFTDEVIRRVKARLAPVVG
ncbi:isocitrate/isopropylmalate dehydrogenase [Symbiobacterium terraclitae]|uniref:Isocitrate/isopropylmalate dehydrogenase n=1 Tax=Symbiobacterium terraclitae TaxID=557451 RepID=A0ABS4JSF0_9FIRM|nr:isocitrate/isopropylmalate family dehydrogenase [Symbiobacterium terraclitae]MBP2018444.1 isocitrate/isopropylmalate dehydrogenase [Symbiobacterium terraclitae]